MFLYMNHLSFILILENMNTFNVIYFQLCKIHKIFYNLFLCFLCFFKKKNQLNVFYKAEAASQGGASTDGVASSVTSQRVRFPVPGGPVRCLGSLRVLRLPPTF